MITFYSCTLTMNDGRTFESACYSGENTAYFDALDQASRFYNENRIETFKMVKKVEFKQH